MEDLLYNPVYNALSSRDAHLAVTNGLIKYFDESVSPFAGFPTGHEKGFEELQQALPEGRRILYAIPDPIAQPPGWKVVAHVEGLQFVFNGKELPASPAMDPVPLTELNVEEMIELTQLTKPGPFAAKTINFGHYHGVFEKGKLVAMTGQRLHPGTYTEISAVCTHPEYLGKGYAAALLIHQLRLILAAGEHPFLHVRADNTRAIALYERLGFTVSRPMHFYFMKRS